MVTNYQFLEMLHSQLNPSNYLEIGVQAGGSLNLARCPAIGIDPSPLVAAQGQQRIYSMTSDDYFTNVNDCGPIDLAYIDGMHLFEYALRDFMNIERHAHSRTVVVVDDVLPYNSAIAVRTPLPGDWTGDVWKLIPALEDERPDLHMALVDVAPTGALVIWNLSSNTHLDKNYDHLIKVWRDEPGDIIPDWILDRDSCVTPEMALDMLRNR